MDERTGSLYVYFLFFILGVLVELQKKIAKIVCWVWGLCKAQDQRSSIRYVYLNPIRSPVPFHRRRKEFGIQPNPIVTAKPLLVRTESDLIFARYASSDPIIRVGILTVKVEYEDQAGSFEYYDFITLMFQTDIGLRCSQPFK